MQEEDAQEEAARESAVGGPGRRRGKCGGEGRLALGAAGLGCGGSALAGRDAEKTAKRLPVPRRQALRRNVRQNLHRGLCKGLDCHKKRRDIAELYLHGEWFPNTRRC